MGDINWRSNPMSADQDFFIATCNGKNLAKVSKLVGYETDSVKEVDYFRKKLFNALGITGGPGRIGPPGPQAELFSYHFTPTTAQTGFLLTGPTFPSEKESVYLTINNIDYPYSAGFFEVSGVKNECILWKGPFTLTFPDSFTINFVNPKPQSPAGLSGYCVPCGGENGRHKIGCPVKK
jgi:hypothetical protein